MNLRTASAFQNGASRGATLTCGLLLFVTTSPLFAAERSLSDFIREIQAARTTGNITQALQVADQAVAAHADQPQAYLVRARLHTQQHQWKEAVRDLTKAIELQPDAAGLYQQRGAEHFRLGQIAESLADFDRAVELAPGSEPQNWQRGITQYYAGRYEAGRKQFELHQTVNPNDVENAAWHFLCVARSAGLESARTNLIPIRGDTRIPMMRVHALFAGKATPEEVLAEARAGQPSPGELEERLFYARLYLGLYFEAVGDAVRAREHIEKAAAYTGDHYMHDVARVHAARMRALKREGE